MTLTLHISTNILFMTLLAISKVTEAFSKAFLLFWALTKMAFTAHLSNKGLAASEAIHSLPISQLQS